MLRTTVSSCCFFFFVKFRGHASLTMLEFLQQKVRGILVVNLKAKLKRAIYPIEEHSSKTHARI